MASRLIALVVLCILWPLSAPAQVVCIDPGHPSENGIGTKGRVLTELQANWTQALLLKKRLERLGIKVVLTKDSMRQVVKNRERASIAGKVKADLMVRLHCDAASGSGYTVYAPFQQGVHRGFRGPSKKVIADSRRVASVFHSTMSQTLKGKLKDNGLKSDAKTAVGARHGALIGSIYSNVPVVLVEMAVLTNPKDEAFLRSKAGQEAMADALAAGVMAVVRTKRKP